MLVPLGIAVALAVTMVSYAGMHRLIYHEVGGEFAALLRPESARPAHAGAGVAPGAFWRGNEHYHGGEGSMRSPGAGATAAMMSAMDRMHGSMNQAPITGDIDSDFVALMIPHHQSAVDMARVYLESGRDPELRRLAGHIIATQQSEIRQMGARGGARSEKAPGTPPPAGH